MSEILTKHENWEILNFWLILQNVTKAPDHAKYDKTWEILIFWLTSQNVRKATDHANCVFPKHHFFGF